MMARRRAVLEGSAPAEAGGTEVGPSLPADRGTLDEVTDETEFRPQRRWLATIKRHDGVLIRIGAVVSLVALWQLSVSSGWVNPLILSRPSDIASKAWSMYVTDGDIYTPLAESGRLFGSAMALSMLVGIPLGVLIGQFRIVRIILEPFVSGVYATPTVAIFPIFILWFGIGDQAKLAIVFVGTTLPLLINTQAGVENADDRLIATARAFRANQFKIFRSVLLPSAVPYIFAGIRLALGRALIMVFIAEYMIGNTGLGAMIASATNTFRTTELYVGVLTLTGFGILLTGAIRMVERWKFSYR